MSLRFCFCRRRTSLDVLDRLTYTEWVCVEEFKYVELVKCVNRIGVGDVREAATSFSSGSESSNKFTIFVLYAMITLSVHTGISSLILGRGGGFDGEPETDSSIISADPGMNVPIAMVVPFT